MRHATCVTAGTLVAALAVTAQAWAQDQQIASAVATAALDPGTALVVELVRGGGLPAVLGLIAFLMVRAGPPTVRVVHAYEDQGIETRLKALERERDRDHGGAP